MVLAIDLSNTHIAMGGIEDGTVYFSCRLSMDKTRTADEYAVLMKLMGDQHGTDLHHMEGAIISSVVPDMTAVLRQAVITTAGCIPMIVGPGIKTGLNIRLDDPTTLASNFVAAAVAALERHHLPCVTVDLDTAISIGVIDGKGCYIGGAIAPGVAVSQVALSYEAALLPSISLEAPGKIIGKNTEGSMRSGIIYGEAAMLDGLLDGIDRELGERATVVATGDWADTVIPHCRRAGIIREPDLLMCGLWLIYRKNKK
jgi:type III pantothenate kinase